MTLFERKKEIGKKTCSGLFSKRILDFIPESRGLIQNEIGFVLIHFPKKTLKVNFSKKFLVISHFELDKLAFGLAKKSGANIVLSHNLTRDSFAGLEGFERVIGCDGANSVVREELGLGRPSFRLAIQGFIQKRDNSDFVETWPVRNGFIWKIPRGKEIEYGIIGNLSEARKAIEEFLEKKNLHLERVGSAIVPQGLIIPKNQKITLVGDAAGLTKPWSGGGVVWGLIAADILLKNFPDFKKYQKEARRFFLPKIVFSKIAKNLVYFFGFRFPWIFPKEIKIEGDFLFF